MTWHLRTALLSLALIEWQAAAPASGQTWLAFDSQPADAKVRYIAKEIVSDLEQPSCIQLGVPPGFDRAKELAPELAAVERFKSRIHGTAAYYQFSVGEADARYDQQMRSGCWNDSDTAIAQRHMESARRATALHLAALDKLVSEVSAPGTPANLRPPELSSEFRYLVRALIESSKPRCVLTAKARNEVVSAPAQRVMREFRQELEGNAYAFDFDMAEGDVNLHRAISSVECDDEGSESASYWQRKLRSIVEKQIARIRDVMKAIDVSKP